MNSNTYSPIVKTLSLADKKIKDSGKYSNVRDCKEERRFPSIYRYSKLECFKYLTSFTYNIIPTPYVQWSLLISNVLIKVNCRSYDKLASTLNESRLLLNRFNVLRLPRRLNVPFSTYFKLQLIIPISVKLGRFLKNYVVNIPTLHEPNVSSIFKVVRLLKIRYV